MSNDNLAPAFASIVEGFINPAETATYQLPQSTGELAQLLGSVYRDAHATGYTEGYAAGDAQGAEDAQRHADTIHNERMHEQIVRYGEMWGVAYAANNDIECLIRQLDELSPIQITSTLRGIAGRLQSQMIKGDS